MSLVASVMILLAVWWVSRYFDRRAKRCSLNVQADVALNSLQRVAARRARSKSVPIPRLLDETQATMTIGLDDSTRHVAQAKR